MANSYIAKDANASSQYFLADGSGTVGNPFVPHKIIDGQVQVTGTVAITSSGALDVYATGTIEINNSQSNPVHTVLVTGTASIPVTVSTSDVVDSGNSTTTPLGGGATFTGTAVETLGYDVVTITLFADQASAADGMQFQFSSDNSNWDDVYSFNMDAGSTRRFQFPLTARYFRVLYTNGATPQTAFRVQTILHDGYVGTSIHRIDSNVGKDRSATLVKAGLVAQINGNGDFTPIASSPQGNLRVSVEDIGGTDVATNTGNATNGTQRVVLATNQPTVTVTDDGAFNVTVDNASIPVTDNGGSLTVDGYVTATGTVTVQNTVTVSDDGAFNVTVDNASIPVTDNGGSLTVDGYVTATGTVSVEGVVSVDDNAGSLTVDNTNLDTLAFGIQGASAGLSVVHATGTSTSVVIDGDNVGLGGGTEYTEDDPSTGGESGKFILGVRNDAGTSPVSTDGDYHGIQFDNSGRLRVVTQGGAGGTSSVDEAAFTLASDSGTPAMGYVGIDTLSTGTVGVVSMTASRELRVAITTDDVGIGGGTQYTEDDVAAGNPIGTAQILVRQDTPGTLVTTDGDNVARRGTNYGAAYSQIVDSSGNFVDTFGGGTQYTEDAASAADPVGNQLIARRRDSPSAETTTDGDVIALNATNNGELYVKHIDTIPVTDNGGSLTVDGYVTATGTVSVEGTVTVTDDGSFVLAANDGVDIGDVTINNASIPVTDNGGSLTVDGFVTATGTITTIESTVTVTDDGSFTLAANDGVDIGDVTINNASIPVTDNGGSLTVDGSVTVEGTLAHDAPDADNPVKVGHKAIAHGTNPTAVAANDITDWYANRAGVPWVIGGHPNIVTIRANYTAAQTDTAIVTIAGGSKIVVTRCSVTNDNATTVDVAARIGFGAASTPTTTGVVLSHPGIAPGSGVVEGVGAGILGVGADGEDLRITSEVPTTGSIDVVVSYYTIES